MSLNQLLTDASNMGYAGTQQDALYQYLGDLGYIGTLNDRLMQYYDAINVDGALGDKLSQTNAVGLLLSSVSTTRSGDTGTYFDQFGKLLTRPANSPRYTHESLSGTWPFEGLVAFEGFIQLVPVVECSESAWSAFSGATLTDQYLNIFGQFRGLEVATNGDSFDSAASGDFSWTAGETYQISLFIEEGTSGKLRLIVSDGANGLTSVISGDIGNLMTASSNAGTLTLVSEEVITGDITQIIAEFTPLNTVVSQGELRLGPDSTIVGETVVALAANVYESGVYQGFALGADTVAADQHVIDLQRTGAGEYPWWNPDEGTFVVGWETQDTTDNNKLFDLYDGMNDSRLTVDQGASGEVVVSRRQGGVNASTSSTELFTGTNRIAINYIYGSGVNFSVNGETPIFRSGASVAFSTMLNLYLGMVNSGTQQLNGTIKSLKYYPRAFTDEELQTISN